MGWRKVAASSTLEEEFRVFVQRLGERLRAIRTARRHSQMYVSEGAGIYDMGILERGREANPRLYTLFVVAKTLDIELKDLLDMEPSRGATEESERIFIEIKEMLNTQDIRTQRKALNLLQVFLAD